ncbi:MAG: L,D-transpeptidase, partial [Myxococcaceae bacterium]
WVMYFEGSFALHGAFWHNGFGAMRSHGCVNMSPPDARWFYHWTEPHVPSGWSGAYADAQHPGTRVYVHYDDQALGVRGGPLRIPQH